MVIGRGAFGPVYKATLPNKSVVAVKVLATNSKQGEKEFQSEVCLMVLDVVTLDGMFVYQEQGVVMGDFARNLVQHLKVLLIDLYLHTFTAPIAEFSNVGGHLLLLSL